MKTQQISGGNIKAIMVSNNSFQEGAFEFSKSKGIGLLRYYDRSKLDWVLTRSPSSLVSSSFAINERNNAFKGLHVEEFESNYFDFYGFIDNQYTNSLWLFLSALIKCNLDKKLLESLPNIEAITRESSSSVKYIEVDDIENISNSILKTIDYQFGEIPLELICDNLKKDVGLQVYFNKKLGKGILGNISFSPLEINIDNEKCTSIQRMRFTLAHELGHLLLNHSRYMLGEQCHEQSVDLESPADVGIKDIMRMEWQANYFASCLLLPQQHLVPTFLSKISIYDIPDRGFGVLYLDQQQCNLDNYYKITSALKKRYNVSRSVIKIRLKKLGYLNEL